MVQFSDRWEPLLSVLLVKGEMAGQPHDYIYGILGCLIPLSNHTAYKARPTIIFIDGSIKRSMYE